MSKLKMLCASCLSLAIVMSSCDEGGQKPTKNGLVAFYKFQENLDDSIGEYDGEGFNVDYLEEGSKKSLDLNGLDAYADLSDPFDFENITISVWFNLNQVNDDLGIIYVSDNASLQHGLTVLSAEESVPMTEGELDLGHQLNFNVANQIVSTAISANKWYNATIIRTGKQYQYFLNGQIIGGGTFIDYAHSGDGVPAAIVGAARTINLRFFDGSVDDLRIYNRGLTPKEVKTIYEAKRK